MKEVYILSKNELQNFLKEPSILTIVILPMIMSKLIFLTSKDEGGNIFLLGM